MIKKSELESILK